MLKKALYLSAFSLFAFGCAAQNQSANSDNSTQSEETGRQLAFPGADGFGKYTTGGRGGKVYVITTLADDGPGSLREAVRKKEPRILVFAVSGNIELQSVLDINTGNLTIAGQSAPGEGITIQNYPIKVKGDNIIIRYIRSRLGDLYDVQDDAMSAIRNKDIIIDHCSLSWATDECASFYDNENFTLQWSIISESLNESVHAKGDHGYGGIWGGKKATFHHNLIMSHNSRLPRFNGSRYHKEPELEIVDFRNNVIYNWKSNSSYAGEEGKHNLVNNYYKAGPATGSNKSRILEPYKPYGTFFLKGNYVAGNEEVSQYNALGVDNVAPEMVLVSDAYPFVMEKTESAQQAFESVLKYAGASYQRDGVDKRLVEETRSGQSSYGKNKDGIIDSQKDVGGWPILKNGEAPKDSDSDGMPDAWEVKNGLDPNDASDASGFDLDKGYTNVEVYLNGLVGVKKQQMD
ncbi:pectate lyase [Rhodonellum sp.]|uniref:pectate lyase n=1 Tax=Rhodonellum sp. TaxID=2231180 RepID=UPI002716C657|nr:pectate lyase [Rhodonellum sp.]MDO9554453.1 pectate lyase [Rhodonellum sp.]